MAIEIRDIHKTLDKVDGMINYGVNTPEDRANLLFFLMQAKQLLAGFIDDVYDDTTVYEEAIF